MDDDPFDVRLAGGELQRLVTDYCAYLRAGRYATNTVRVYVRCVAHFGHWLGTENIALSTVNETTGRRFLAATWVAATARPQFDACYMSTGPRSPTCSGPSRRRA